MTDPTTIAPSQTQSSANGPLLKQAMAARAKVIEGTIDQLLPPTTGGDARLVDAMRYATLGGGKRLRGYLAMATASLFDVPDCQSARVAASVEMLHAYSLVHDDLPAMDDDDLRRGQPSTHRKFDEATAILAGDALQTKAFEILAEAETHENTVVRIALITAFAQASGAAGMVGGQMIDMEGEGRALPLEEVRHLHALKTGCLIRYSAEAGAILGQAKPELQQRLRSYGANIGAASRLRMMCWTPPLQRKSWARRLARMKPPANPPMLPFWALTAHAPKPSAWPKVPLTIWLRSEHRRTA